MVSRNDLILRVEDMLYGTAQVERPEEDVVTLASTGATTMTIATDRFWRRGRYGEIAQVDGTPGEIVYCAADGSGTSVSVRRAQRGTTAAVATAQPARVDPRFPRSVISRMIDEAITDHMYPHVWYQSKRSLTWNDQDHIYDLADEDYHVIDVYQVYENEKHPFPRAWWIEENLIDTTVGASGKVLRLRRVYDITETVYYTARSRPLVADLTSLPDRIVNLVPWKVAALTLGGTRPVPNRADPNRQALPPEQEGGAVRDWRYFEQMFLLKRNELNLALRHEEKNVRQEVFQPRRRRRW